jgi:hypothetical protein
MPKELTTMGQLIAAMRHAVDADPTYADEVPLFDMWNRQQFGEFVEHEFTDVEWEDFVHHCMYETTPWEQWFNGWKASNTSDDIAERRPRVLASKQS